MSDKIVINEPAADSLTPPEKTPILLAAVPRVAPFFEGAHLLIAADCAAYTHSNFIAGYMKGKITLICCQKQDNTDYTKKLTAILRENDIKSVTIIRVDLRCCSGNVNMVMSALQKCGKIIPWWTVIVSTDGEVISG